MKRILIIATLIVSISTICAAQHRKGHNRRAGKQPMKELNLTEEQKQKIKNINEDYRKKEQDLSKEKQVSILAVLTTEQRTMLDSLKTNRGKFDGNRHSHRKSGKGLDKRKDVKRELSPEAIAKLSTLEDNYFKEKQAIKNSRIAIEEQNQKITELRKKYRTERMNIVKEDRKQTKETNNKS